MPKLVKNKSTFKKTHTGNRIIAIMQIDNLVIMQTEYETYRLVKDKWVPMEID